MQVLFHFIGGRHLLGLLLAVLWVFQVVLGIPNYVVVLADYLQFLHVRLGAGARLHQLANIITEVFVSLKQVVEFKPVHGLGGEALVDV